MKDSGKELTDHFDQQAQFKKGIYDAKPKMQTRYGLMSLGGRVSVLSTLPRKCIYRPLLLQFPRETLLRTFGRLNYAFGDRSNCRHASPAYMVACLNVNDEA